MPVVLKFNLDKYTFPVQRETVLASPHIRAGQYYILGIGLCALHLHHAAEAHEGHGEDTGGDEGDGYALHRGGKLGACKLLAYASEDHQGEREADSDGDGIDDAL